MEEILERAKLKTELLTAQYIGALLDGKDEEAKEIRGKIDAYLKRMHDLFYELRQFRAATNEE